MKVTYARIWVADCTSDPHPVGYDGGAILKEMFTDILRVCESDLVKAIRSVEGKIGDTQYKSDIYDDRNLKKAQQPASGAMAQKHKIEGLYFWEDYQPDKNSRHLSPGLTGLDQFIGKALNPPNQFQFIRIGVVWIFAGEASCSDYIKVDDEYGLDTVNYGSQDWWIDDEGYQPWCQQMADLLGRPFPYKDGKMQPGKQREAKRRSARRKRNG